MRMRLRMGRGMEMEMENVVNYLYCTRLGCTRLLLLLLLCNHRPLIADPASSPAPPLLSLSLSLTSCHAFPLAED